KMIAERDGYNMDEIMFIDDSYTEIMEAFGAGILSMHTTEVMERYMYHIFRNGISVKSIRIINAP
ncbi:MAG: hypothetical protein J6Y02_17285, partial [Pseudobutyrivibrio sp.]|nr:hypothetical protein [Pseudobutyrivibrio sp.]